MKKKYILFDNDGVLVHTEPLYYEASKKALKEYFNLDLEFDDYMQIMARGGTAWEKAIENGFTQTQIIEARTKRNIYYQDYLLNRDIQIDGVKDILQELSKRFQMAIITTSRRVDFELIHSKRGIVDYMDFVLCEEDYTYCKPHPEPYLKGLKLFNAKKEDTVVVEDSQRGLTSAHNAGIDCVVVHNEFTKTQDFTNAKLKIERLEELLTIL